MIMNKSQGLQDELASWRPGRANGVVPVQGAAGSQEPRKGRVLVQVQMQEKTMSQLEGSQEEFTLTQGRVSLFVLLRSSADWIGLPTLGRTI